jgi:hypothetical protein
MNLSKCFPATYIMISILTVITVIPVAFSLRLGSLQRDTDVIDTSNCTWSNWTVCGLKKGSYSQCESTRSLELAQNQTEIGPQVIPCMGQAGSVESKPCNDGNCPLWNVGNWSDCSNTCNTTMADIWSGMQVRHISCSDPTGWYYANKVCVNIRGQEPLAEQACPCSHKTEEVDPYGGQWTKVPVR